MSKVITFHYTLTNASGDKIDSSVGSEPLSILSGAGQIIKGLDRELQNMNAGDKKQVQVKAAEAYGRRDESKVYEIDRNKLPAKEIKIGDRFRGGNEADAPVLTVTKVGKTRVTLDANHPLAGEDLTFDVEVTSVREATKEEVAHGHVHGSGGHHHH